jgi:beta-barrel assembly-enhancing protease
MQLDKAKISRRALTSGLVGLSLSASIAPVHAQFRLDLGKIKDISRMLKSINFDEDDEIEMGNSLFGSFIQTMGGIYRNSDAQSAVTSIAQRLFETSARKTFGWEVVVVDNNEVNAWALPGGKVGVNKGLLRYVDSEDELAAVIAHEMGHVELSHAAREMRKKAFYSGLSSAAQTAAVAAVDEDARRGTRAGMKAIEMPMMRLVTAGYSRDLETEADMHIVDVFSKTGYNVMRGAGFYQTLLEIVPRKAKGTTSLFAGHPQTTKRLAALREAGADAPQPGKLFNPDYYALKETFPTRKIYKRTAG